MSIFSLFKKTTKIINENHSKKPSEYEGHFPYHDIHPDIKDLLWYGAGPNKNFVNQSDTTQIFISNGVHVLFSSNNDEPSLIFPKMPVEEPKDRSIVTRQHVIDMHMENCANPIDSCILMKSVDDTSYQVVRGGTIRKFNYHLATTYFSINENHVEYVSRIVHQFIEIVNEWMDIAGYEFFWIPNITMYNCFTYSTGKQ